MNARAYSMGWCFVNGVDILTAPGFKPFRTTVLGELSSDARRQRGRR